MSGFHCAWASCWEQDAYRQDAVFTQGRIIAIATMPAAHSRVPTAHRVRKPSNTLKRIWYLGIMLEDLGHRGAWVLPWQCQLSAGIFTIDKSLAQPVVVTATISILQAGKLMRAQGVE